MCAREKPYKMGRVQIVGADLAGLWLCPNFKAIVQKKEMLYPNFKSYCSKKKCCKAESQLPGFSMRVECFTCTRFGF